jgi:hypothetical protein
MQQENVRRVNHPVSSGDVWNGLVIYTSDRIDGSCLVVPYVLPFVSVVASDILLHLQSSLFVCSETGIGSLARQSECGRHQKFEMKPYLPSRCRYRQRASSRAQSQSYRAVCKPQLKEVSWKKSA